MRTALQWLAGLALLSVLALTLDGYWADIYRKLLLTITLCMSYNFLFGVTGQIAFSHIAFYGIGSYLMVILTFGSGIPLPLSMLLSVLICALMAFVVAVPATRLHGFYLALATLAFAQFFGVVILQGGEITGGPQGLSGFSAQDYFGLLSLGANYTIVIVLLLILTMAILLRLDRSWFGRACRAIRDNEAAAEAMGVNVFRVKVAAFTVTSTMAGVAGIVYAFVDNTVNPLVFGLEPMFLLLFMAVIGGAGRHSGAIIGAVVLFLAPEILEEWIGRQYFLGYGVLVVAAILFQQRGLIGLVDGLLRRAGWRGEMLP